MRHKHAHKHSEKNLTTFFCQALVSGTRYLAPALILGLFLGTPVETLNPGRRAASAPFVLRPEPELRHSDKTSLWGWHYIIFVIRF